MFLTSQNQLLSCGMNDLGQLGLGENQDFTASVVEEADVGKPTLIEPLEEMKVRSAKQRVKRYLPRESWWLDKWYVHYP